MVARDRRAAMGAHASRETCSSVEHGRTKRPVSDSSLAKIVFMHRHDGLHRASGRCAVHPAAPSPRNPLRHFALPAKSLRPLPVAGERIADRATLMYYDSGEAGGG